MKLKNIIWTLRTPINIYYYFGLKGKINIDDEKYIKWLFKENMGYKLDLNNVKTFDEKLQWLKLYDRNPIYSDLVDKYEVKKYVSSKIGSEYVIPTLGVFNSIEEINFDNLPSEFVIKCTHDSGGVVIVHDKNNISQDDLNKLRNSLGKNYYYALREWPYKNINPRIIVEQYMEDRKTKELRDYKFYTFNGRVEAMMLATNRHNANKQLNFDYFDRNGNHLNLENYWHPKADVIPELPEQFEKMIYLAESVSKGIAHVRVDFYEVDGKIYFGEFTFYDQGGFLKLTPTDWEKEWGDKIDLSLAYKYKK